MIIESENQYQQALSEVHTILEAHGGSPPDSTTVVGKRLGELMTEIKIYENRYHSPEAEQLETYEFWVAKEGKILSEEDKLDPENFTILKLKENELKPEHIDLLVGEFINNFDKLPQAAKRRVRQKLRY